MNVKYLTQWVQTGLATTTTRGVASKRAGDVWLANGQGHAECAVMGKRVRSLSWVANEQGKTHG